MASSSSLYVTDDDDMEFEVSGKETRIQTRLGGKRCISERRDDEGLMREEGNGEPAKLRKSESDERRKTEGNRRERERIDDMLKRRAVSEERKKRMAERERELKQIMMEEEEDRSEEQRSRENEEMSDAKRIDKIQMHLKRIMKAVSRESVGKIAVTKGDQATVRLSVFELQCEMVEMMKRRMVADEELQKLRNELREKDEELKKERRKESRVVSNRRIVGNDEGNEGEWEIPKVRRQARTYAQVSKGVMNEGDRLEGRVLVVGNEGWKTPPTRSRRETGLIVSSNKEKDAKKLAETLAKTVTVKDIGGAPKAVRRIRDGQ